MSDGVYINPSRADPGLVKVVDSPSGDQKGQRLMLKHGPASSLGNAAFVSVIVVEEVRLRESVYLSGGNSSRKQKRVNGCLFHGEAELKAGFLGAAFKYDVAYVNREFGAETFTSRMSPTANTSQSSPSRRSRFTETAANRQQPVSATSVSSYASWPSILNHDSPGKVWWWFDPAYIFH